ncbi:protein FAM107B [Scomber scombrus]|uniref:Protein FAM107B n=1 Tax=Scomber scombrus TaxID=13677 RepID=A0AAV1N8F8_SCOSC
MLENKRREQHKRRELALLPPSDLEVKLRRRQQRLHVYELEQKKRSESLLNVPVYPCERNPEAYPELFLAMTRTMGTHAFMKLYLFIFD